MADFYPLKLHVSGQFLAFGKHAELDVHLFGVSCQNIQHLIRCPDEGKFADIVRQFLIEKSLKLLNERVDVFDDPDAFDDDEDPEEPVFEDPPDLPRDVTVDDDFETVDAISYVLVRSVVGSL